MSIYANESRERPTPEVEAMGKLNFTGNIIPHSWRDHIRKEDGRAKTPDGKVVDLAAINVLAWVVYWYRPAEVVDEKTNVVLGWRKRFWGDVLQASYDHIGEQVGLTKAQVKAAIDRLEAAGIVRREFRNIVSNGVPLNNVLYIHVNTERIEQISFPYPITMRDTPHNYEGPPLQLSGTNTEITTETTTQNPAASVDAGAPAGANPEPVALPAASESEDKPAGASAQVEAVLSEPPAPSFDDFEGVEFSEPARSTSPVQSGEPWATWAEDSDAARAYLARNAHRASALDVKRVGYELERVYQLVPARNRDGTVNWSNKRRVESWLGGIINALEVVGGEPRFVLQAARKLIEQGLTLSDPWALEKTARALSAELGRQERPVEGRDIRGGIDFSRRPPDARAVYR